jgi:hypothetical protein
MEKDPYIFFQKTNSFHLTKVMGTFGWRAFLFWTNDSISVSQNGLVLFHIWKKEQSHPIFLFGPESQNTMERLCPLFGWRVV